MVRTVYSGRLPTFSFLSFPSLVSPLLFSPHTPLFYCMYPACPAMSCPAAQFSWIFIGESALWLIPCNGSISMSSMSCTHCLDCRQDCRKVGIHSALSFCCLLLSSSSHSSSASCQGFNFAYIVVFDFYFFFDFFNNKIKRKRKNVLPSSRPDYYNRKATISVLHFPFSHSQSLTMFYCFGTEYVRQSGRG